MTTTLSPDSAPLVIFLLDDQRYALRLSAIRQIVRAVEITPLPQAPGIVQGIVNIRGEIVPVFDLRQRFHLPVREPQLSDCLIVAQTATGTVACLIDHVTGVIEPSGIETMPASPILPGLDYVEGVVKLAEGLVFIHDLDTFLSRYERQVLEQALSP